MEGNHRMGMVIIDSTTGSIADFACEVEITECEPLPDGRFYLEIESRRRFRIVQSWDQDGYRVAEVEWVKDIYPPEGSRERAEADGESVDHLFLHCDLARELWNMAFSSFGMYWVMPKQIVDVLASWKGRLGRHKNRHVWEAVPHCVMWRLWRERNARTFEDRERNILD
uniref:Lon N-terminal domain-containing protein n=1 Tax=Fagus sylvatica TaxID=28930 RepID=A0A2N9G315_FAGSY